MAFCNNCGTELPDGAKYCHVCGKPVNTSITEQTKRQQVFEGKIHKCPNCGETIASFHRNCPTCGFEFRGIQSSNAIKDFTNKLESIEASRTEKRRFFGLVGKSNMEIKNQKIDLILNYPVPNTIEDLMEFMILATSNANSSIDMEEVDVATAWMSKAKQIMDKANKSCGNNNDIIPINDLYINSKKKVGRGRRKIKAKEFIMYFWWVILFAGIIIAAIVSSVLDNRNEERRLGEMVRIVETAIDNNDYVYALRNAESMEYNGRSSEREKWWNIQRATLVDRVILEAGKEGIYLEPSPTPTIEPTSTPSSQLD